MKLIYVHHAERDLSDKTKPPEERKLDDITENGIKEATFISEKLKGQKIKSIITSPYPRCIHTAEILNKYLNVPIIEDNRFNEFARGEDLKGFLIRNMEAIDDIVKTSIDDDVVICVTSGVNIGAFICYSYNIKPSNYLPWTQAAAISPVIFNMNNIEEKK